jgi:signal transduction histidine kinase/ActR/RegA family two-component response regulator
MKGDILSTNDDDSNPKACNINLLELFNNIADRRQNTQLKGRRSEDIVADECTERDVNCEDSFCAREDHAHLREILLTSREHIVALTESSHELINEQMRMLQQANSKLITATLEATELSEKLEITTAQLEIAKCIAENANSAKSDFLSSMSHELRTPLNAILGFAQLLESGSPEPTDAQTKKLNQITKAGWYLLDLINQILELAAIESGKLSVINENVSLSDIISECQIMIDPQAQNHNISLYILPFDSTLMVNADKTRIKQVLFNLLSNAIKYNRDNGTVEILCSTVTLGKVRISIKDSGFGLSQDKLDQLFQPFNRLGQEKGLNQGTGIGLMICKELVELMGGTIGVTSLVGVGTEFWVEFSRNFPIQTIAEKSVPPLLKSAEHTRKAKQVLLYVEDNSANLTLVEQIILDYPNITMLTASNGDMGIALARAKVPDVILLDINLPGISGFEVLKILQNDLSTAHIPVLAISANALAHDVDKALKAGFYAYLTKPIKIKEFMNTIEMAFKLKVSLLR